MSDVKYIDIQKTILSHNDEAARTVRQRLAADSVTMINLMAAPGAGKTSLILQTIDALSQKHRIAVIEGDIESTVDAEKIAAKKIPAVQLRTGGMCHLDAPMIEAALDELDLQNLDLIIIENIGNLVCPAEYDLGAHLKIMMTSVPEGDDKVLKYPAMFSACEALLVNKTDYLPDPGFDRELLQMRVKNLNPDMHLFFLSCRSGAGIDAWADWLHRRIQAARR